MRVDPLSFDAADQASLMLDACKRINVKISPGLAGSDTASIDA